MPIQFAYLTNASTGNIGKASGAMSAPPPGPALPDKPAWPGAGMWVTEWAVRKVKGAAVRSPEVRLNGLVSDGSRVHRFHRCWFLMISRDCRALVATESFGFSFTALRSSPSPLSIAPW